MTTPIPNPDPLVAATVDSDVVRTTVARRPERLLSLDVLRGLTIAFMIIVNDQMGPEPFSQLHHAAWNGFTATDLVFPTFLFLVGISTVLSTASRLARGATRGSLFLHTARRALLLVAFGFVVNNFPSFHMANARYYGVLPRIGVCYFVVASLYLVSPRWKDKAVLAVFCLVSYWVLMRFVPVPGYGIPTHTVAMNDHDGNLAAWLDRRIFSAAHLYEGTRDPEGLLSTIPAVATALFGMLAGLWLRTAHPTRRKAAAIAFAGLLSLCLGLAWDPFFPINKKLWTSSFVLFAGGWSMLLLTVSVYLIDVLRVGRSVADPDRPESSRHSIAYTPLLVLGTNAITAYLISELGADLLGAVRLPSGGSIPGASFNAMLAESGSPQWASLLFSLGYLLLCWLPVLPLYRKRIFLRI
jgi:predicted acyltransferase